MRNLWVLLEKRKSAREVVALLAPIAIAAAGGIWAVVTYVLPSHDARPPTVVCAQSGSISAGHNASHNTINYHGGAPPGGGAAECSDTATK